MSLENTMICQDRLGIDRKQKGELTENGCCCFLFLPAANWRALWSAEAGTTDPEAPFGIVVLADSTGKNTVLNSTF